MIKTFESGSALPKEYLSIGETAEWLNCSKSKVEKLVASGHFSIHKLPFEKAYLVPLNEVRAVVENSQIKTSREAKEDAAFSFVLNGLNKK